MCIRNFKIILLARVLLINFFIIFASNSHAFSAMAFVKDNIKESFARTSNFKTQKEADNSALKICRNEAKKNGIAKIANQCSIFMRGKGPGFSSITCGEDGCGFVAGYSSSQDAVDAAYSNCSSKYKNCNDKNIDFWEDIVGFPSTTNAEINTGGSCRPKTSTIRCSSSCNNGNCIVSYENGCKLRVQVPPKFNPFNNQWEFPSPAC